MSKSRYRPSHNAPRPLDDVRVLRAGASNPDGRAVGLGMEIDAQGRYARRLGRAEAFDNRGRSYLRLGGYLGYATGSPERAVILPGKERLIAKAALAPQITLESIEAAPARITELDNRTRDFLLNHDLRIGLLEIDVAADNILISDHTTRIGVLETQILDHESRIAALEADVWLKEGGTASFTIGAPTTIASALVQDNVDNCEIHVLRKSFSGTIGHICVNNIVDDTSFDVDTDLQSEKGEFRWWVRRKVGT